MNSTTSPQDGKGKPIIDPPILDGIPAELRELPQWIYWRLEFRGDKWTKIPYGSGTGSPRKAKADKSATWLPYIPAVERYRKHEFDGIGFEFHSDGPYFGIDLDDCRDPETGEILPSAMEIIEGFVTSSWDPIPGNPLPWIQASDRNAGHGNIIRQICQAVAQVGDWSWDVICFLEHDVLYPADYFERVGAAFAATPEVNVVSNLDYEGLNATGWLAVKERHEPMHQLSMRREFALANLDRAELDCSRQGWAYLEPQGGRLDWLRLPATGKSPSIHVNHARRFTSHGEVCYEAESSRRQHPVWGDFQNWWPEALSDFPCIHRGDVLRQVGCGCGARDKRMDVHACRVHGECTVHASGKAGGAGRIRACIACEGRQA